MRLGALALIVFLAVRLRELWRDHPVDLSTLDIPILVVAAALSIVAVVSYGTVWPLILRRLGQEPPPGAIGIFLQSQLGKYVPGGVWQYAGRVGLARTRRVPTRTTLLSLVVEVAASALAALVIGLFVLPIVVAVPVGLLVVVVAYAALRDPLRALLASALGPMRGVLPVAATDVRRAMRALPSTAALYVPVWVAYGLAFWATGRALVDLPAGDIVYFTAAFALGWLAGMAAVFAPGGIGVREAVLVALIASRVGQAEAIVIAAASRLLLTGADLLGGAGAVVLPAFRARRTGDVAR